MDPAATRETVERLQPALDAANAGLFDRNLQTGEARRRTASASHLSRPLKWTTGRNLAR
jgi:hypothetical protein